MKKTLKYVAILAVFGGVLAGCKALTKGYSTDPYGATSAPAPQLFAGSQGAFIVFMEGYPSQMAAIWAQEATGTSRQFQGYSTYNTSAQDYANDWLTAYTNVLYNLRLCEGEAAANGQKNLEGAAKILEAIQMGTVTALWGDVPYSEAAQPSLTKTPKFDAQLTVYAAVQAKLDTGIALLSANKVALQSDIFSSAGSAQMWLNAAYTAKARYAMQAARHGGYTTADLNNVIALAQQGIVNTDGSQDIMFLHTTGTYNGDMNLWYSFGVYDRSGYIGASRTFSIDMLQAYGMGNQMNFYYDTSNADLNYSSADTLLPGGGPGAFSGTSPFPMFRASEANLLIAEAYARLGGAANLASALTYLNNAITYNNAMFGDTVAAYAAADPAVATQSAMLQTIFNMEYLSLFPQVELFNFVRRVDYDIKYNVGGMSGTLAPTQGTNFPQRFFYPTNEITANPNTPKQTAASLYQQTTVNSVADPMLP